MSETPMGDASWIDAVATRFDRAWKAGHQPRIEDFLAGVAESRRGLLLAELLRVELEIRRAAEEPRSRRPWRSTASGSRRMST
jgi:hypothetical protein